MFRTISALALCGLLFCLSSGRGEADFFSQSLASSAPFRDSRLLGDLDVYARMDFKKAFAVSATRSSWGWSYGYRNQWAANRAALRHCERNSGTECLLYAIGDSQVWDQAEVAAARARALPAAAEQGSVWRYYGEERTHDVPVVLPSDAPSIISDYQSERGVLGGLRAMNKAIRPRHTGIDILAKAGAPVLAAADGIVRVADFRRVAGYRVKIVHQAAAQNAPGGLPGKGELITVYLHLEEIFVAPGERVKRGQRIGTVGTSGKGAVPELPHLHFGTLRSNPHLHWHDGPGQVTCFLPGRRYAKGQTALTYPIACGTRLAGQP